MKNTLLAALAFAFAVSLAAPAPAQDHAATAAKPAKPTARQARRGGREKAQARRAGGERARSGDRGRARSGDRRRASYRRGSRCAAPAPAPAAAAATAPAPAPAAQEEPAPPAKIDRAEAIKRANAFFNASPVLNADFVQIGSDGKRSEGKLYSQRAGRVRFEYAEPATLELVADGARVMVRDLKLKTQDIYAIDQTPLKFLLKEKIDFEHDVRVLDVTTDDNGVAISLEDKATFGGTSHLKLIFDPKTFKLRQWQITDPQGYETLLSLFNIDQKRTPDPALFKIDVNAKSE